MLIFFIVCRCICCHDQILCCQVCVQSKLTAMQAVQTFFPDRKHCICCKGHKFNCACSSPNVECSRCVLAKPIIKGNKPSTKLFSTTTVDATVATAVAAADGLNPKSAEFIPRQQRKAVQVDVTAAANTFPSEVISPQSLLFPPLPPPPQGIETASRTVLGSELVQPSAKAMISCSSVAEDQEKEELRNYLQLQCLHFTADECVQYAALMHAGKMTKLSKLRSMQKTKKLENNLRNILSDEEHVQIIVESVKKSE